DLHVAEEGVAEDARGVEGAVDRAEPASRLGYRGGELVFVRGIGLEVRDLAAELGEGSRSTPDLVVLRPPADPGEPRARRPGEVAAQRGSDPAGAAEQDVDAALPEGRDRRRKLQRLERLHEPASGAERDERLRALVGG